MNQELEKLIDIAIVDGNISEGKKDFLIKKATELGVDLAELEMVISAKLFQMNHNFKQSQSKIFSEKIGKIEKCTVCNAIVNPLELKCNSCGNEIKKNLSNQTLIEFLNKINALSSSKKNETSQKVELITHYPVSNNKEDLFEFLTICIPQIEKNGRIQNKYEKKINTAWLLKSRQILIKAKGLFKNDLEFIEKINEHEIKVEKRIKAIKRHSIIKTILIVLIFIVVAFLSFKYAPKYFEKKSSYDLFVDSVNSLYGGKFNEFKKSSNYQSFNIMLKDIYCSNYYDKTLKARIEEFNNSCKTGSDIKFFGLALSQNLDYNSEREIADKYIDTTLALNPNFAFAYNLRGEMLSMAAIDSGFMYFNKAISLRQDCWKFYFNRAKVYAKRKSPSDALNDIMTALKLNPNDIHLLFYRAMYLIALDGSGRDWCSDFNELKKHKDFELLYDEHWIELDKVFEVCSENESYYFSYEFN